MLADMAFPTTAIDVTHRTTLDIGIGTGCEACGIVGSIVCTDTEEVINCTRSTCSINVGTYFSTEQSNVGGAVDVTTKVCFRVSQSTTIGISHNLCTFIYEYIGVVFPIVSGRISIFITRIVAVVNLCGLRYESLIGEVGSFICGVAGVVIASDIPLCVLDIRRIVITQCPGICPFFSPAFLGFFLDISITRSKVSLVNLPIRIL